MKENKKTKAAAILLSVMMVFAMAPLLPLSAQPACAADIPQPDVTYTQDDNWEGTLEINENKTVKISGVTHENSGPYGSAIKISGGATVNLIFEGTNIISGNPDAISAGIEVEAGSTVNIYGEDGSTLTVTGGKYSAGIGGIGYGSVSATNPAAGNIIIHSGTIKAIGGDKGAGIGAGYHSSASDITIMGGDITALGTGSGAGIGCGYGTSGGAAIAAGIGFYSGGNITISGGTVRAAGWHMNFDNFDQYDPETMYGEGYADTFAAGIGGGYGASSGTIVIEGDADVIALGSCGGAGIGCGRGTSKEVNYDAGKAFCDITIRGNAKVVAMSTEDRRESVVGDTGGAGIGLGRGWGLEGDQLGTIVIDGNANVYAYADSGANGIGASVAVGKFTNNGGVIEYPANLHVESLSIGPNCTVVAECGQPEPARAGFDEIVDPAEISTAALEFAEGFFETAGIGSEMPFFTEDRFPAEIEVRSADNRKLLTALVLARPDDINADVHIPAAYASVYYKVKDYLVDGRGVLLAHADGKNGWKFENGENLVTNLLYEKYKITYNLNGGKNASGNPAEYAVYGAAVKLKAPTRSGYTFGGWFENSKLSGSAVKSIPSGSVGDKQYWAKWSKKKDPAKSVKGTLLTKMTAKGKTSLVISWSQIKGADGYDVFFSKCGKNACKLVKTIKGSKNTTWTRKGLKKKTAYKAYVKAFVMKDGKKSYVKTSPIIHAYSSGGKKHYTNAKSVTVSKSNVKLAAGKTFTIKAKVKKLNQSKKLMKSSHAPKLRYISSNKNVAAVNSAGKVTAKGKGACNVYVYAVNGVKATVKITVR